MYKWDLYAFIRLWKYIYGPAKEHIENRPYQTPQRQWTGTHITPARISKNHRMTVDEDKDEKKDDSDKDKKDVL